VSKVLSPPDLSNLPCDDLRQALPARSGQRQQPVGLVATKDRDRRAASPRPTEIERDAERGGEAEVAGDLDRSVGTQAPGIGKETWRAAQLAQAGLRFVDVGTSGGIWGLKEGYCLMAGGAPDDVARVRPALETLAPAKDRGWAHVGPAGSGHFVKMVHNGIEYGLMQASAEGFELMQRKEEFALDLAAIAEIWRYGSVVRSWLLDLTAAALKENPTLSGIAAYVSDSGEGRWTVQEAIDLGCSLPVITLALQNRFRSRTESPFSDKLLAAMRNQFGGHAVKRES